MPDQPTPQPPEEPDQPRPEQETDEPVPPAEDVPITPRQTPTIPALVWGGVQALNVVVGILTAVVTLVPIFTEGKVNFVSFVLLLIVVVVSLMGIFGAILRGGRASGKSPTFLVYRLVEWSLPVMLLVSGFTVGRAIPVIFPSLPPPTVLYVSYVSTRADESLAPPVALRPSSDPPQEQYKVKSTLGYGYPLGSGDLPGTHLVYDHFCRGTGNEKPCGGFSRSHYYSKDQNPQPLWGNKPADEIKAVARLLDADTHGQCPREDDVAIYSISRTQRGATGFDVAVQANPGDGGQLLGCLRPPS